MADALELDALWAEFHRVVNMTSQELAAWLRVNDASEEAVAPPEHAGAPTGEAVLAILQKRRIDLTEDDLDVMYEVVDAVTAETGSERGAQSASEAEETRRRHRLMTLGHDPSRPQG
ncbi:DUF3140 domain-containing protein [Streptomyces sp. NPDC020707]|jgi:hypothetical protein|uniref:DUF3140 domain-containing protein n=1 Tax=Streptomyces ortus TaxID=2867268 RepID=A0ABT3VGQ6_9ACTN|nr:MULTISPECIES: DUF3140 domain-containing protein [Streptomyces]MCX4237840.1 DUF3140 domain-containing protein [Streptomyces ortus]